MTTSSPNLTTETRSFQLKDKFPGVASTFIKKCPNSQLYSPELYRTLLFILQNVPCTWSVCLSVSFSVLACVLIRRRRSRRRRQRWPPITERNPPPPTPHSNAYICLEFHMLTYFPHSPLHCELFIIKFSVLFAECHHR